MQRCTLPFYLLQPVLTSLKCLSLLRRYLSSSLLVARRSSTRQHLVLFACFFQARIPNPQDLALDSTEIDIIERAEKRNGRSGEIIASTQVSRLISQRVEFARRRTGVRSLAKATPLTCTQERKHAGNSIKFLQTRNE